MWRLTVTAVLVLAISTTASSAAAQQACHEVTDAYGQVTIICRDDQVPTDGEPEDDSPPDEPYVRTFGLVTGPDGFCIGTSWVLLSSVGPGTFTYDEAVVWSITEAETLIQGGFLPCPGVVLDTVVPEAWAREYLRTVALPVPAPAIAPGQMVVGWESFLEVGSPIVHRIDEPVTPFGPATFTFTSTVTVDWGDGEVTGPASTAGGPYPDGDLRHVYVRQGAYDIVVTQEWVATWQVGGEAGTVSGLVTEAVLGDFPVQEIEAVLVG